MEVVLMMRGILQGFSWMVCLLLLVVAQPTQPLSFLFTGYRVASSWPSSTRQQPGNLFLLFFAASCTLQGRPLSLHSSQHQRAALLFHSFPKHFNQPWV